MRRSFRILFVLAIAALVVPAASADEQPILGQAYYGQLLDMYQWTQIQQEVELEPVSLPPPGDPAESQASARAAVPPAPGPVSGVKGGDLGFDMPMVGPRGGGMSTPKQRADREIKTLIKKLG